MNTKINARALEKVFEKEEKDLESVENRFISEYGDVGKNGDVEIKRDYKGRLFVCVGEKQFCWLRMTTPQKARENWFEFFSYDFLQRLEFPANAEKRKHTLVIEEFEEPLNAFKVAEDLLESESAWLMTHPVHVEPINK